MATADIGVNSHHQRCVLEFLHFARFKRGECLKAVEGAFSDLADSRLVEDTFTCEEVREMLGGLREVVRADVETELISSARTNVLLLRQLLQQAEKWHLKLHADVSELENRELIEKIAKFEKKELDSPLQVCASTDSVRQKHSHLEPINALGGEKLLQLEIDRVSQENRTLKGRLHTLEAKASSALKERDKLKTEISKLSLKEEIPVSNGSSDEVSSLRAKISQLQDELSANSSATESLAMKEELAHTTHELLRVKEELEETQQALEMKFSETAQYSNMRKMLLSKNELIKELRAQLSDNK